jgi:drug/metabolite transporter (DMT)-like permease
MGYACVVGTVLMTVLGQLLLRWRVSGMGREPQGLTLLALAHKFLDPWVIGAIGCAFAAMFLWMGALARLPLSHAYPLTSMSYILVLVLAHLLFGESIGGWRVAGMLCIVIGITCCGIPKSG